MSETYTFNFMKEVSSLLHAADGKPFPTCVQCGTCSGTCPVAAYMDYTPRQIFAKMIVRSGRTFEPILAPSYIFSFKLREFFQEVQNATELLLKGRLPLLPARIKGPE